MFDLKNKVALVTGGANGIGAAIVREFLKEGVKFVSILDVQEKSGAALAEELTVIYGKDKVKFFKCDVTKDDELFDAFEKTADANGGLDIVVNNAGIANDEMYKKEIEVNFMAVVTSTIKALELMRSDRGGKGGTVVNVSSVSALALRSPTAFVYGATKAGVLHFTSTIGKQPYYSTTNVRTLSMCFGATDTELISEVRSFDEELTRTMKKIVKYNPLQTAEEAAKGVVEAYRTGDSGSTWLVWCKVQDVTERVTRGYDIMAGDIFD